MRAKIKNNQIVLILGLFLTAAVFGLALFSSVLADDIDCGQLTGDDKKKCEILEKKAEDYQDLIDIKNKQQATLQKQMQLIDTEQARTQAELATTKSESEELEIKISDLERDISYKEDLVSYQRLILTGMMQSYYEYYQQGVLDLVLINRDFSSILNQADYMEQTSVKINEILDSIQKAKAELESEQNDLEQKKQESEKLKQTLEQKKYDLLTTEAQKQNLLTQTQGEEAKYQQLLTRVEAQKKELFNFSEASNLAEIDASVGSYAKPDSKYWASTSWYFSQKDSRWGNKTIGNSNSLMKDYGCAVTSLSMVFDFSGASGVDPGKMAKQKIFYYDLIKWPSSWDPDIELASSIYHGNINWKTVDKEIAADHPVIVFIKKTNGRGGHYVVIHNKDKKDYVVHDPYFGSNLYLGTSRALVGALGANSGTKIDQMIIYH
jgi:peptidoglycan hydrolase CwlO-like protein